jgi:hypothetical protein
MNANSEPERPTSNTQHRTLNGGTTAIRTDSEIAPLDLDPQRCQIRILQGHCFDTFLASKIKNR